MASQNYTRFWLKTQQNNLQSHWCQWKELVLMKRWLIWNFPNPSYFSQLLFTGSRTHFASWAYKSLRPNQGLSCLDHQTWLCSANRKKRCICTHLKNAWASQQRQRTRLHDVFGKLSFPHHFTLCELCMLQKGWQKPKHLREQTSIKPGYNILHQLNGSFLATWWKNIFIFFVFFPPSRLWQHLLHLPMKQAVSAKPPMRS